MSAAETPPPPSGGRSTWPHVRQAIAAAATIAALALTWWAYLPGLSGGFLFDDYNNLDQLGAYGRVDDLRTLILYVTSGTADPTGRPLSLLSFLIDANTWPADPAPFKRTNVLLHLINGALLAWALTGFGKRLSLDQRQARRAAVLSASLWALHPLFVSTTLYIVQREAMLPATFTLLGMVMWLGGTDRLASGQPGAWWRLLGGAWGCTALAVLSKANGALLPLLLLVTDWALPARDAAQAADPAGSRAMRRTRWLLLGLPSLLVVILLASKIPDIWMGRTDGRPWTVGQRLLSEGRVLCDYLQSLWIPRADAASVFNDGFRASAGLLRPWTTLPSLAFIVALLLGAIRLRKRHPTVTLAIVFFFAGHLLESTVIQLELYFEHRNYLPAMPMFWPLAVWLTGTGPMRGVRLTLTALLPLTLAALCHARAGIWGNAYDQALLLAAVNPDSPRAQANAAQYEMQHRRPDLATARLAVATHKMPTEVQLALNWVGAECASGAVHDDALAAARYALAHNAGQIEMVQKWLVAAIAQSRTPRCQGLGLAELNDLVQAAARNPSFSRGAGGLSNVHYLQGRIALARGDGLQALRKFNAAVADFAVPDRALLQAALLGSAGFPKLGLEHLRYFDGLPPADRGLRGMEVVHQWLLVHNGYWTSELTRMRRVLEQDAGEADGRRSHGVAH